MRSSDVQIRRKAKRLVELSKSRGRIAKTRVEAILAQLKKTPPQNYKALLKCFAVEIERALRHEKAVVEHAGELSDAALEGICKELKKHYGRTVPAKTKQNDALLAGVRIQVGDDVWEDSLAGQLNELKQLLEI